MTNLANFKISKTNYELNFYGDANTPGNLFGYLNTKGWFIFGILMLLFLFFICVFIVLITNTNHAISKKCNDWSFAR